MFDFQCCFFLRSFQIALVGLCVTSFNISAFALTADEYQQLQKQSYEFRKADALLNSAWADLKDSLSKDDYEIALTEQKKWLTQRDALADKSEYTDRYGEKITDRAEIYAQLTYERYHEISVKISNVQGMTPSDISGIYADEIAVIEIDGKDNGYFIRFNSVGPRGQYVCAFEGKGTYDNVLLTLTSPDEYSEAAKGMRIFFRGRRLMILDTENKNINLEAFCGLNGSVHGVYYQVPKNILEP